MRTTGLLACALVATAFVGFATTTVTASYHCPVPGKEVTCYQCRSDWKILCGERPDMDVCETLRICA
jgi:hypothetical protein